MNGTDRETNNHLGEESDSDAEVVPDFLLSSLSLPPLSLECSFNSHLVRITNIESPSNFYVRLEDENQYYEMYLKNLNDFYSKEKIPPTVNELPIASYWCVHVNGNWMRAKIISNLGKLRIHLTDEKATPFYQVFLVDTGVTTSLSLDAVRFLNDEFTLDPPMAIPCFLSDVFPLKNLEDFNWSPEVVELFSDLCSDKVHVAVFWKKKMSLHYDVILEKMENTSSERNDNPTINELMVFSGSATSTVLKDVIEGNHKLDGLEDSENEVKELSIANDKKDPLSTWNPMDEHHKEDNLLNDQDADSYFLGYVNDDEKKICSYIRYNKPCQRGNNCKWLHIEPRKDGLPSGSDEIFTSLKCPPLVIEEGNLYRVLVLTAASPSMFYSLFEQEKSGMNVLWELQDNLAEAYKHEPPKSSQTVPALGELMVLNQKEGEMPGYFRVRVLNVQQEQLEVKVKVMYIDYGNQEWVKECQLRPILECFLYVPAQAVECYLFGVNPKTDSWEAEAIDYFCELVDKKIGTGTVLSVDNHSERYGLEIEYDEGELINVNSTLMDRGYAENDNSFTIGSDLYDHIN